MTILQAGKCACGAPATHRYIEEGIKRSRAITGACCGCYEAEMRRAVSAAGLCRCGHVVTMHDVAGCRIEYCTCTAEPPRG